MAISNPYNPNPQTVDSILQKRQLQADSLKQQGLLQEPQAPENFKVPVLGTEITPNSPDKSFLRKVGEDAAMLAYAIPVGLAQAVSHPFTFVKNAFVNDKGDVTRGALGQSVRDAVDPNYYKAHPLLGIVNLAGFVAPIAGAAKSAALKTAMRTSLTVGMKEAVTAGVSEEIAQSALKESILKQAVTAAAKTGNTEIIKETIRNSLMAAGVEGETALKVGTSMADNVFQSLSRQSSKMAVLDSIAHPVGAISKYVGKVADPIRETLFGSPAKTAVAKIYGADVVAKNPEGFINIEKWAEAQTVERGMANTVSNRQRVMNEWVDQNSQWASLTPEEQVAHFNNYAAQDLTRLKIAEQTGIDMVTVKALPQNYVDSMVRTVESAPADIAAKDLVTMMEDTFGNDFKIHSSEIAAALAKGGTDAKAALISVISKLGDARSTISFTKFSPEIQALAKELETTGYRLGHAPTNKIVSYVTDVFKKGEVSGTSKVMTADAMAARTAFGNWIDKWGFSTEHVIEGAPEYAYRQNFTQNILKDVSPKYGTTFEVKNVNRPGMATIPAEKLFEWLDKNKTLIRGTAQHNADFFAPARTVFDLKEADLLRAGLKPEIARAVASASNKALREVPTSIIGAADKVVNYIKTQDKGFGAWMTKWYEPYLKVAYKFRYDLSPFFAAQQWLETKINSALLLKNLSPLSDVGFLPGGKSAMKLGNWTLEKLGARLGDAKDYLPKIVGEPTLAESVMVRDEVLGTLQKTMLDYTSSPDLINIQSAAQKVEGLAGEAGFRQSTQSRNFWYAIRGESSVRMATQVNKGLAEKFGMTIEQALDYTIENGQKVYKNPQMVQIMRELTQDVFHYREGVLTSPLVKTMNVVWFPFRFQAKTIGLASEWLAGLEPTSRMAVINNWVHFANWAGTDEGLKWRRTNRNFLYQILNYSLAYGQIGQSIEAVSKGQIFGGNTGLIGGVPFGFMVNLARELSILPGDPDQFDPKTGRQFMKQTPKDIPSAAALSVALEQLVIQILPGMPFYTLTGGVISGVSPRGWTTKLIRMGVGGVNESLQGRDPTRGYEMLQRQFKRVPLDYSRLSQ